MRTAGDYFGGWVTERAGTGTAPGLVLFVGWMAGAAAALTIHTGEGLSLQSLQRLPGQVQLSPLSPEITEVETDRTPHENLSKIRKVLNPSISDLATTFNVSRQSIYNWLNGGTVADENAAKLRDLANAADVLEHARIAVSAAILKRKFSGGRTLLQVVRSGESARDAALLLVQISAREAVQRDRMLARAANKTRKPPTADFDLPAPNDHV